MIPMIANFLIMILLDMLGTNLTTCVQVQIANRKMIKMLSKLNIATIPNY